MTRMTIGQAFTWLALRDPDRLAVRDGSNQLTRSDLDKQSNQVARLYQQLGVTEDSMVAVSLPNSVDFVVACVAIWKLGATPMPLSPDMGLEERQTLLDLARPSLWVTANKQPNPGFPTVGAAPNLEGIDASSLPIAAAACWKAPTTSGSTGRPKIVRSTAAAWIDPEMPVTSFIPQEAVQLVTAPMTHSAPFTYAFRGLMTGHSLIIHPRFDERRALAEIPASRITWAMFVPTMMHRIMRLPLELRESTDVSSLESILHIGAPCAPELKREWLEWLGPDRVMEVYAGTESQGLTAISGQEWLEHPGSVGLPIGGTSLKIVDESGQPLPSLSVGEILMTRAGGHTYEYLGGESSRRDGWDSLGDLGFLDDDGYLFVCDRLDDLIISGGVNVFPADVERVLERHPKVRSAVAFGVQDEDLGQRVEAIVDIADAELSTAELMQWLRSRLEPIKQPRRMRFVRDPLRNDAGKVRRKKQQKNG